MSEATVISTVNPQGIATVTLNRPERRNAFDADIIRSLTEALQEAAAKPEVRVVVLAAAGKHFSAGADLNWMRDSAQWSQEDNLRDAHKLAGLMSTLDQLAKPTIARVQGAVYGGAVGLVSCCDIAVASDDTRFCLSEARLGLAPAVISPYVLRALGARQARRYFLTTEEIPASKALNLGLVHEVVDAESLDNTVQELAARITRNGPTALAACKTLIETAYSRQPDDDLQDYTTQLIARLRTGSEGQEGLTAFFEKRAPAWHAATQEDH
ncbi:enoyl-CoA hydratase/isomerase family protein [Mangrovitalea sediminis]|uniref:enoyl-CoA hydratase/isomerase family protein n=1 Tax=Mangrovitalea sediminis TaxID=1982043 RepID=UPI000BE4C857|nr:enoyl-CoA hydratase/isomerase family protein [Mangrovitalea sediminis]